MQLSSLLCFTSKVVVQAHEAGNQINLAELSDNFS